MADARTPFRTKRELAVARVKDAIMLGRYRPGQALRQVQLMADLDLGATPAREAVLELVAKGLLVHESHRGMRVAALDAERVHHVYSVRALLESEAARLSAGAATDAVIDRARRAVQAMKAALAGKDLKKLSSADGRFHQALYENADNPILLKLIEQMRDRWEDAGIASVTRIGDCWAPSTIQQAVYTGHKWARELDEEPESLTPRELPTIEAGRVKVTI